MIENHIKDSTSNIKSHNYSYKENHIEASVLNLNSHTYSYIFTITSSQTQTKLSEEQKARNLIY